MEKVGEKRREKMLAGNNPIMLAVDARDRADYVGGSALAADADWVGRDRDSVAPRKERHDNVTWIGCARIAIDLNAE